MTSILFATMLALTPCADIYAVKRIWDTNEYYVQYSKNGPWFRIEEKELKSLKCEIKNYTVVG
jgi:hypothetical protein